MFTSMFGGDFVALLVGYYNNFIQYSFMTFTKKNFQDIVWKLHIYFRDYFYKAVTRIPGKEFSLSAKVSG